MFFVDGSFELSPESVHATVSVNILLSVQRHLKPIFPLFLLEPIPHTVFLLYLTTGLLPRLIMAEKCVHKGCGKVFSDPDEPCVYHPGPPIFHEGQKGSYMKTCIISVAP